MEGHRVLLILRDPLETFVRMARRKYKLFVSFTGNIQFYHRAATPDKMVAYYDEIVASPEKMAEVLDFLQLEPAAGKNRPSSGDLSAAWEEAGEASRALYSRNQWHSRGAMTRKNPLDFKFHQRKLRDAKKAEVWRHLDEVLAPEELALVERFRPSAQRRQPGA